MPHNGESSAAGSSRENSARHSRRGLQQTTISSFTSVRTNDSEEFELVPTSRGYETTGSLSDLEHRGFSVGQPTHLIDANERTSSGQARHVGGTEMVAVRDSTEPSTPQTADHLRVSHIFESTKTHYIYKEAQHDQWTTWWESTPGYQEYRLKYGGKKRVCWNSSSRGAAIWKYYQQCATKSGKDFGRPNVQCIVCGAILAHPAAVGTTSMHDHNKSIGCKKARQANVMKDSSAPTLEELWSKHGTKVSRFHTSLQFHLLRNRDQTGNRKSTSDSSLPDGYDQAQFDRFFIEAMLATNLSFNATNNAAFRRMFKYLKRDVLLPAPTTVRGRLQAICTEIEEKITAEIPPNVKISIAADAWTSPNKLAFLGIVGYWITDDWEMKEVLLGFEQIHGAHTGENMAGVIGGILKQYGIESQLLGFTTDSASNNTTLARALDDALSLLSIDWNCEHNHIPCMAHVVQLILGSFMGHLKIKSKGDQMPSTFMESYVEGVASMEAGFFKTVEKVCSSHVYYFISWNWISRIRTADMILPCLQHRKLSIAVGSSPQRREYFLDIQEGRVKHPVSLIYDVKTRWNSTLIMLERALRMKNFTREWIKEYQAYAPLWSTPCEWKQVEYILQVLEPIRFCTLWMSKTRGPTIHRVFQVYDTIFDHLDNQITALEKKRIRWKVEIREALEKARAKAAKYYGKTENPRGLLMALGVCLNPYSKLDLFEDWDQVENDGTPPAGVELYSKKYREMFIQYYNENYRPQLEREPQEDLTVGITQVRLSGFSRRSRPTSSRPYRPTEQNEAIDYLNSKPEVDYTERLHADNHLYEADILGWWKNNAARYPNLSRMARDILAVQGGSVGVESMFSMGRDIIRYRRNRLEKKSIRATMIVRSYLQKELRKDAEGLDPEEERDQLQNYLALADYESSISTDTLGPGGYISDDDERGKKDTSWEFVEHDGERAFRRERVLPLPPREERSGERKRPSELIGGEDIHPGSDDDEPFGHNGEVDEEEDEYVNFDSGERERDDSDKFGSTGEDLDIEDSGGPGGEGGDSETNVDINEYNEPQRSRKRAGSNLARGVGKKFWKRK